MSKALVEVELPDGWELAEPAMRLPLSGDYWLSPNGVQVMKATSQEEVAENVIVCWTREPRVILRPAWQWPTWIKAPWIARTEGGSWWAFQGEPTLETYHWIGNTVTQLDPKYFDFTPPPCDDWRTSKRKNPNV